MKKLMALLLAAGLVGAALAGPVQAGKGKGKGNRKNKRGPATLDLFLRWDDDGAGGCGPTYLSTEDGPDAGNSCAFTFQAAQEALVAAGQEALNHSWPSVLDKPFKLYKGKIKGEFTVRAIAATETTLEVEVSVMTKKGFQDLGSFTSDVLTVGPTDRVPVSFEIGVPKNLSGQKIESVGLTTTFRGFSVQSYIELDSPASYLKFPILK